MGIQGLGWIPRIRIMHKACARAGFCAAGGLLSSNQIIELQPTFSEQLVLSEDILYRDNMRVTLQGI